MLNQRCPPGEKLLSTFLSYLLLAFPIALHAKDSTTDHWAQVWGASQQTLSSDISPPLTSRTLAQRARISMDGHFVRIKISNELGKSPLKIGAASIVTSKATCKVCETPFKLSFGGSPSTTIPPGALAFSDEIELNAPALSELEIRLFIPGPTDIETGHHTDGATTALSHPGDYTAHQNMPVASHLNSYIFLSGIDVRTTRKANVVVTFGDSLTRGLINKNWPDRLAEKRARANIAQTSIVNSAIGGTMLTHGPFNGQARFDRDALLVTGATHVILLMGTNDIGSGSTVFPADIRSTTPITAEKIIGAYQQLIRRAHAQGLKIFGGTLPPFAGAEDSYPGYYTKEGEKTRQAVNNWIRNSGKFDAVIDFEKALQNPQNIKTLSPEYDSGDHLHINDAGYKVMADAIDLSLFQ